MNVWLEKRLRASVCLAGEEIEGERLFRCRRNLGRTFVKWVLGVYPAGLTSFGVASAGPVFFGYKFYLFEDALESFILCLYLCSSEYLFPFI